MEQRATLYGLDLRDELGIERIGGDGFGEGGYMGMTSIHLDAFRWVKWDFYLPQGIQRSKNRHEIQTRVRLCTKSEYEEGAGFHKMTEKMQDL